MGDALGSGPSARKGVGVQIPFPAVKANSVEQKVLVIWLGVSRFNHQYFALMKRDPDSLSQGYNVESGQIPFPAYATFGGMDCPVRLYLTGQAMITERLQ